MSNKISMFEKPEIPVTKPWENKGTTTFRQWLSEQTAKNPENWSADFRAYVDQQYATRAQEDMDDEQGESDSEREKGEYEAFERTLKVLALDEKDLQNKRILDLGCYDGGFVITALQKKLSEEIFGLDQELEGEARSEEYAKHFFIGDFTNELPVKNIDLIVSVGAVSLYLHEAYRSQFEQTLARAIDALNAGGELRIGPLHKVVRGEDFSGVVSGAKVLTEVLQGMETVKGISWEFVPIDINVTGYAKDVLLDQVLIIKPMKRESEEEVRRRDAARRLEEARKNVETLADGMGKGIDEGIKETIAVFNVLDIPTAQSCEGHPDKDSGGPYPWVRVQAEGEPEERFVGEAEAFENMALQHGIVLEALKKGEPEDLYWEVRKQISVNEETPAFQEWTKKNIELQEKVQALLNTFYQDRVVSDDMKLIVDTGAGGVFHVRSDEPAELRIILREITPEEFSSVVGKLGARQEEMRAFTDFLRDKVYLKS